MTAQFDESLEHLRLLCELVRVANPALERGAAELGRVAQGLSENEQRLSLDLDHLATEVDGLQKEAETSEAAAVKACQDLGHAAEEVNASGLAEVEKEAAAAQVHWTAAFHEKSSALDSAFQEVAANGWEPLDAALASEQADFEKWTQAADDTLQGLVQGFATVATDVQHQGTVLDEAARGLEAAPPFPKAYWHPVASHGKALTEETVPHFGEQVEHQDTELGTVHEHLAAAAGDGSTHVRAQMDLTVQMAVTAIDAQANEVTQMVQTAVETLQTAHTEFERSQIQADDAEKAGHELVELAGHVAQAEVQLQQVQAVLEALGQ